MPTEETSKRLLSKKDGFTDILGQEKVKKALKSALLANRNIILVGPPGIGKTTLAKNLAQVAHITGEFVRVQGSPDLTVEDLLGDIDPVKALEKGPLSLEAFQKGKIFKADKGILFFDELNRCPEKLQNALLQVLQEKKATLGSYTVDFDLDFIFIATMNPEDSSTEPLSDVLLDRFDLIHMNYPESQSIEENIVLQHGGKLATVPSGMLQLMVHFIRNLRQGDDLEKKPSVRATLGLYERSQTNALLEGRKEVIVEDIQEAIISVLSHRIRLKPSLKYAENSITFLKKKFNMIDTSEFDRGDDG